MLRLALALALIAAPAHADPITLTIASLAASAAITAAGLTGITLALAQLGVGLALMIAAQSNAQKGQTQADLKRGLARPDELTPYRYVYGHVRTYGSPAPWRIKGNILYACLIFNSRPSSGNFKLIIDQREVTTTGSPFNFGSAGGRPSEADFRDYMQFWIGRGNQTRPPQVITDEAPELFRTTDAWQGRTVLWVRLDCGPNDSRAERWPSAPPAIQMEADWSLVWDPRDSTQSATDASTWKFSRNRSLIVLDALRNNPIREFPLSALMLASFRASADIDDQAVPLKAGGTEPRYCCDGLLTWNDSEIEDQIGPLLEAGAGGITRIGGQIGMIPGAWQEPEITITDVLDDDGLTFDVLVPGEDLATAVRGKYMSADDWEMADAGVYIVPGAQAADGGLEVIQDIELGMVTSATQAQRLLKIRAWLQRMQKKIACVLPPDAFQAVGGTNIRVNWPAPYSAMNGAYAIQSIHPALDLVGDDGVAMRCPVEMTETTAAIWAWDPATEERDVQKADVTIVSRKSLPPPGAVYTDTGGPATTKPRIRFYFDPVDNARIDSYAWEYRESGGSWQAGGTIDAAIRASQGVAEGKVYGFVRDVEAGTSYDIRVRSMDGKASASVWSYHNNVVALGPVTSLPPPTPVSSDTTASGDTLVTFRLPSDDGVIGIEIWTSGSNSTSNASKYVTLGGASSMTMGVTVPRNGAYYWGKTRGAYGYVSGFSASIRAN